MWTNKHAIFARFPKVRNQTLLIEPICSDMAPGMTNTCYLTKVDIATEIMRKRDNSDKTDTPWQRETIWQMDITWHNNDDNMTNAVLESVFFLNPCLTSRKMLWEGRHNNLKRTKITTRHHSEKTTRMTFASAFGTLEPTKKNVVFFLLPYNSQNCCTGKADWSPLLTLPFDMVLQCNYSISSHPAVLSPYRAEGAPRSKLPLARTSLLAIRHSMSNREKVPSSRFPQIYNGELFKRKR